MLTPGRYGDDEFGGADTIAECAQIVDQAIGLCKKDQFHLQKWYSNDPRILAHLDPSLLATEPSINFDSETIIRTLGLSWNPSTDSFRFYNNFKQSSRLTKRITLSRVAQLFDPLGFIAPVIITAKIFMQKLWLHKLDWDQDLPDHLQRHWNEFERHLKKLDVICIPRHLKITKAGTIQIHGFSDASTAAMSAVVYLRIISEEAISVSLVQSKTKLAPISRLSIPRLELSAAVLLTRLVHQVSQVLDLISAPIWLWTDSSVTLTWLTSHPSKWKDFVANRVSFVQQTLPTAKWRFVPGKVNPADCATRGMTPDQLQEHTLWWQGPPWLAMESKQWPDSNFTPAQQAQSEVRKHSQNQVFHASVELSEPAMLTYYSELHRLIRLTAWCLRFINRAQRRSIIFHAKFLSVAEVHESLLYWIKRVQAATFAGEIKALLKSDRSCSHHLKPLNPFIDKKGFLRVGGRLDHSNLCYDSKHPYILPKSSHLTTLIIRDAHHRTLHGGTTSTLALLRQQFWILSGRNAVRSELLRCTTCVRLRAERMQQLMGHLPCSRVISSRPFQHAGVDYAGPFTLKERRGRSRTTYKAYVALFICAATSFIHLELVTAYTSEAFIAAYKRFAGIYGSCQTLTSDQGTNFIGADREIRQLFAAASAEAGKLSFLLAKDGTHWKFNPPSAPNFGGHWEAGVKSMKYHLKRVMKDSILTFEEFTTTLSQIQAVLNSRPLCRLTDDPDDMDYLTPGHFFVGGPITTLPEPSLSHLPESRLSYWQLTQQLTERFWEKWRTEHLQQLQARYKWQHPQAAIQLNDVVLILDERYPPSKWPLARVVQLHPGTDGIIRVVTVKTAKSQFDRPINKLCRLPTAMESGNQPAAPLPPDQP